MRFADDERNKDANHHCIICCPIDYPIHCPIHVHRHSHFDHEIPLSESIGIADSITVIKNPDGKQNSTDDPTNFAPQNPEKLDFPVFVGIGDSDELFSVDSCRELYEGIPSDSKEFYVAEGAKHAEFPDGAWDPLVEWVDRKFG